MLSAFAVLLSVTALLAYLNERFFKFPTTVGVALSGALSSVILIVLDELGFPGLKGWASGVLSTLNFTDFVLNGVLSLLLFAGALSLDTRQMLKQSGSILLLAVAGTLLSTFLIGGGAYAVFGALGLAVPLIGALIFGALISPTDPVAVLDLLRRARVPKRLETLIAGESLFNDGVGVVLFLVVAGLAGGDLSGHPVDPSVWGALRLFAREALGGVLFGALLGGVGYLLLRSVEQHAVEVLITLALVLGGYVAASALGVSGPLAMVVVGLTLSGVRYQVFGEETREHVESFWETLDQVLNILLFAFIGLDVLLTTTSAMQVLAGALLVAVALLARFLSVGLPFLLVRRAERGRLDGGGTNAYGPFTVRVLTWGGLRGGIAISLVLSLPESPYRATLITATYIVVLFTIAVQGLSILPLIHRASEASPERDEEVYG